MRALHWGRNVKILATLNGHSYKTTIMNVGYGPSFLVQPHTCRSAGLRLNDHIDVKITTLNIITRRPLPPRA
jgi:hypothetical protein